MTQNRSVSLAPTAAVLIALHVIVFPSALPAQSAPGSLPSAAAKSALEAALSKGDTDSIIAELASKAAAAPSKGDKKYLLASLADYAERCGRTSAAAAYFHDAAFADPSARDDSLLLDSARCLLESGDIEGADSIIRAVSLTSFDETTLLRSRAYSAWINLFTGERASALAAIRILAGTPQFAPWAPSLYFTLWWAEGDQAARDIILAKWPASPEAAVLRGKIALSPVAFWYLMPRNDSKIAKFAADGSAGLITSTAETTEKRAPADEKALSSAPEQAGADVIEEEKPNGRAWQQVGFFKNREYADDLMAALKKAGFTGEIHENKRPSGTVYFAVLVPEDSKRTVAARLKNAGFESYLVTE